MLSYFISLVPLAFTPYSLEPLKRLAGPSSTSLWPRAPLPTISRDRTGRWAFDPVAVAEPEPESPAPAPFTPMPLPGEWLSSKKSSPTSSSGFATPSLTSSAESTPASSAAPSPQQASRPLRSLARPRDSIDLAPDFGFVQAVQAKLRLAMAEEEEDGTGLGFNFAIDGSTK